MPSKELIALRAKVLVVAVVKSPRFFPFDPFNPFSPYFLLLTPDHAALAEPSATAPFQHQQIDDTD
jgi:hypothetical protein